MTKKSTADKNLARTLSWRFGWLTPQVAAAKPQSMEDVWALVGNLFDKIWGRDKTIEQHQAALFAFGPWDDLQPETLQSREMPLPREMVPQSYAELVDLCEKLLDRTGDSYLREQFLKRWPGKNDADYLNDAFKNFCGDLWKTSQTDPEFFSAVVRGMHGTALSYLVHKETSSDLTRAKAVGLVSRMALTWAAHDVQATVARARLSKTRPLAGLIWGLAKDMKADTVFAVSRPVYKILLRFLSNYRTNEEIRQGKPEGKLSKHDNVATIRSNLPKTNRAASADLVALDGGHEPFTRRRRDRFVQGLRRALEQQSDEFWAELKEPTGRFAGMTMSEVWFRGLKPAEMSALAAIRLAFWEEALESHILSLGNNGYWDPRSYKPKITRWKARVAELVLHLHRVILHDAGPIDEEAEGTVVGHSYTHIHKAEKFIDDALRTPLSVDGQPEGKLLTFAYLDVCVNVRLRR